MILSAQNLSVAYKTDSGVVKAVNGVSFDVAKGESFVIVGRSGSGKSTVVSAIMGLTDMDGGKVLSGKIMYGGKNLLSMPFDERRILYGKKISVVFQDPQSYLNPVIKVGRQIEEAVVVHNRGISKKDLSSIVNETLKKVKLDDLQRIANSYPHQLSGGQKQRILIAMAIINSPQLLIADEPTTGLDAAAQKQILDLIEELKQKLGLTLIMITHNMKVAKKYSDKIAVMHNGEITESASVKEIFENPKSEYTKMLIEAQS
ncbi:MAG: ABC transporter ATP-binding protein [Endomicrobium sp.]|jgi:ABC-type dipeptide/oligopeptide/nickel transport system ATPase component|nr:ABC transporter ATP-binding protein [Endomicrobium sp.]